MLDLLGVGVPSGPGGTSGKEQRGTGEALPGSSSGKDRAHKAGWPKVRGAGRESERLIVPTKACKITRWRGGALL
jgi:hypothetical protein